MKQEPEVTQMIKKDSAGTDRDGTTMLGAEESLSFNSSPSNISPLAASFDACFSRDDTTIPPLAASIGARFTCDDTTEIATEGIAFGFFAATFLFSDWNPPHQNWLLYVLSSFRGQSLRLHLSFYGPGWNPLICMQPSKAPRQAPTGTAYTICVDSSYS